MRDRFRPLHETAISAEHEQRISALEVAELQKVEATVSRMQVERPDYQSAEARCIYRERTEAQERRNPELALRQQEIDRQLPPSSRARVPARGGHRVRVSPARCRRR